MLAEVVPVLEDEVLSDSPDELPDRGQVVIGKDVLVEPEVRGERVIFGADGVVWSRNSPSAAITRATAPK